MSALLSLLFAAGITILNVMHTPGIRANQHEARCRTCPFVEAGMIEFGDQPKPA